MENLVAMLAAGARRLLGMDAAFAEAVKSCASCAQKPICETGALADCPSLKLLQERKPL